MKDWNGGSSKAHKVTLYCQLRELHLIGLKKTIVIAGIAILAVAKFILMKYLLFDQPGFEKYLSGNSAPGTIAVQLLSSCGADPVMNLIIGWNVVAEGAQS